MTAQAPGGGIAFVMLDAVQVPIIAPIGRRAAAGRVFVFLG